MRIYSIVLALGVIALGIVLTTGGNAMAQPPGGVRFAFSAGSPAVSTGSGLHAVVPVVPVGGRHYRGWNRGWRHWSAPRFGFYYGYPRTYFPKYRYRNWGYAPGSYSCWSDGWQTYCGFF